MANRMGKHSAPLSSSGRRPAHSADVASSRSRQSRRTAATTDSFAGRSAASQGFGSSYAAAGERSYNAADSLARARQARKKGRGKKIALGIAAALVVILVGAGTAVGLYLNNLNSTIQDGMDEEQKTALLETLAPAETEDGSYYVAIFGSDAREGETVSRSDVTMLARIDENTGVVDLISVPRDTMIEIEGQGKQKINAAYAFGGPSGAVKTLSEFAGVPISHYVEVHFDELQNVVDELGGIQVNIPESFYSDTSGITLEAGEQTINGAEALAFARERHATRAGDFSRAQAQRLIIEAIVEKVLQASPAEIPGLVESLARCVTTDYSVQDLISLALTFKDKGLTMYSAACPSYTLNENGVSYVGTQYKEWQDMMRRVDAGLDPNDTKAEIPEPQASDEKLGAATNARSPQDYEDLVKEALTTDDVIDVEKKSDKESSE
ncbi:MAG: LCP family protein [Adlercreutzia sp.]|nr:LCP family protein [Adlercreutzia sp.]